MSTHTLIIPSRMKVNNIELSERKPDEDFAELVFKHLGDLSQYTVLGTSVLVATYIKSRWTAGGIMMTDKAVDEDRWQGKVGLVVKTGEDAFKYTYTSAGAYDYTGPKPDVGKYIMYHASDARELAIKGISCKLIDASLIKLIVPDPDAIY